MAAPALPEYPLAAHPIQGTVNHGPLYLFNKKMAQSDTTRLGMPVAARWYFEEHYNDNKATYNSIISNAGINARIVTPQLTAECNVITYGQGNRATIYVKGWKQFLTANGWVSGTTIITCFLYKRLEDGNRLTFFFQASHCFLFSIFRFFFINSMYGSFLNSIILIPSSSFFYYLFVQSVPELVNAANPWVPPRGGNAAVNA